jgi:transcriptional regulator with XRE-family HTH domain
VRPEHSGVYGRGLFKMLCFLGISQQQVCQRLGVSKSLVSMWARGKRTIRGTKLSRLLRMAQEAFAEKAAQGMSSAEEAGFRAKYQALYEEWLLECNQDYLYTEFQARCRVLAPYCDMEPDKIKAAFQGADGLEIARQMEEMAQIVRLIRRVPLPPEIEAFQEQLRTLPTANTRPRTDNDRADGEPA